MRVLFCVGALRSHTSMHTSFSSPAFTHVRVHVFIVSCRHTCASTHALSGRLALPMVDIDHLDNSVLTFRGLIKCRPSGIVPKRVRMRERWCARVIVKLKS